jgi:copper(I)-binding protein
MGPGTSAIYMIIHNDGSAADHLLSAAAEVATAVELHETRVSSGMSQMHRVRSIDVPAGGRAELRPGGLHIMLLGLERDLAEGSQFPAVLRFEKAGSITVRVPVRMTAP